MAIDRQHYICQGQSMNMFMAEPTDSKLSSMIMYSWKGGLKTGLYYLRSKPAARAQQFTLDASRFSSSNCTMCSA